ncbi:peptidase C11 [Thermotoga maritima MSB8]|uniref:Clostripain-related protein n=1 Tax=Thermotoga maritima (strain ATCC 43589 / DSM 3109 / JCM 10099 / NBRC 100826 / MSB8) TaxID=243274 RepID=Q9WZB1_THEMA|nr:clostripain-related cysteine peptidase [Thermotoga maritima]AAD35727.1 clostripain-related protein [Thermotoga maritima MSB8]AGL49568.1 clostripain-related protein [Thermotoga maritima MSB8]AHD17603.1 peptidase C11 [Thermotoga maritima MSB8]AKE26564.1 peptidase C11 [Thermotoga maritima]AKE28429.1 peptidase C11 [Thermotoga maritima MSB8]
MRWFLLIVVSALFLSGCMPEIYTHASTPSTIIADNETHIAGRYAFVDVQVLDEYGLPVSGEDVSFYVDGAFLGEATTDTSGVARIGFFSPSEKTYTFTAVAGGVSRSFDVSFTKPKWLFIVWMAADNNLYYYSEDDLSEMRNASGSVSVVVVYDGIGIGDGMLVLDESGNFQAVVGTMGIDFNSGSYTNLEAWLEMILNQFDADHYALVIWDHGSAWIGDSYYISTKVIGYDDFQGTAIAVSNLRKALENALSGDKLDILGFDACLMGSLEVIYELRNTADYIVASSFNEPAEGWDYSFLGEIAPDSTPLDVARMIVDSYREYYSSDTYQNELSLAVYDTSQVEVFVSDLNLFISDLKADLSKVDAVYSDVVKSYIDDYNQTVLVDLGDFIDRWVSSSRITTAPDLSSVVVYSYGEIAGKTLSFPISIFMPESMSCYQDYQTDYQTLSFPYDTQWDEFLEYWLNQKGG